MERLHPLPVPTTSRGQGALALAHAHWFLALGIVGIVAVMILPVPAPVLDMLIAFNMACGIMLLMLALYIPGVLGLSTFPSLIVLTTVMRLALNVASTKQILLHAHAGHVIETFGALVMGGNVVVGLVVFTIIALVQFIVISKGAERVAEVGARFTLDAMPGKQMSIEADLRAGFIDKEEGRRQRAALQQESQLHGAMDGAMKFVKGDAIAAIVIALVNIVAGIAIGMGMMGMGLAEAAARYTLLSVGDGMVSQIPSLMTSVAAGVLITRVSGQEGGPASGLASQIGLQVLAQPRAILACSAILFSFVLVPGFPKAVFLALGAAVGSVGWWALRKERKVPSFDAPAVAAEGRDAATGSLPAIQQPDGLIVTPLLLRLAENLRDVVSPTALHLCMEEERKGVHKDLGLPFPRFKVVFDASLPSHGYAIDAQEVPAAAGLLAHDAPGGDPGVAAEAELAREVGRVVRTRPDAFVGMQEIQSLIKLAQSQLPDLSEELLRALPLQKVTDVLRRLALEGVSLRYLREMYESLLTWHSREKDIAMLCEYVRIDLGRFICQRYIDAERSISVVVVDAALESRLRESVQQGPAGAYVALAPDAMRALHDAAQVQFAALPAGQTPVILATLETRRFLRRALAARFPHAVVLSYQELPSDVQIVPTGRLSLAPEPRLRTVEAA